MGSRETSQSYAADGVMVGLWMDGWQGKKPKKEAPCEGERRRGALLSSGCLGMLSAVNDGAEIIFLS